MSLHIGNLSSHIRRDELERVFQRFGRCNVRMKDGYGFVVYDFPPNAEKALRALHKRNICGKPLTLSWSNKQPRPLKRFARTARSYEPQHGGNSGRGGDHVNRKLGSNDQQEYRLNFTQADRNSRLNSAYMHREEIVNRQDDIEDHTSKEHQGYGEDFLDERGRVGPDPVDNDRWGEQFHNPPNEVGVENGVEFDRYDPYEGFDRRNNDENLQRTYSGATLTLQSSQENAGGDHIIDATLNCFSDVKSQETCYKCGGSGHKMRNCPQENASRRNFTRFDSRHTDDIHRGGRGKGNPEKNGSRSREKLQSSRDAIPGRRLKNDKESSGSGRHEEVTRNGRSAVAKETDWSCKKEYERKKQSTTEIESPKRHGTKKGRQSTSSFLHSDDTTSRLHSTSHSSKHLQRSHYHSRSKSVSSSLRSGSTSLHSRSQSSKTMSRSLSPASLSLSVSLGQALPSSSNKAQLNMKGSSDNATTPESKEVFIEEVQPVEDETGLQGDKHGLKTVAVNDNTMSSSKVDTEMEKYQPLQKENDDCLMVSNSLHKATDSSTQILSEEGTLTAGNLSLAPVLEMECQDSDTFETEHVHVPLKKLDPEAPVSSSSFHSTSISAWELSSVLKHYGLGSQDENEKPLPAEAYFGSARLWPWEIIYYRRLKKGPISIENYARRVDQNREFSIVDKYIRSSSGWGELQENL
ncbi:hypothetical protein OIU84_010278 [Salix udensis]|uniref:Uncharacterized protein n=1 Tax=Salix udensis TaxID=889485 RepID=A0AAD6JKG8_9ROSI|nr:hypothetical protein OIU84_010278 [Salix udensis]